MFKAVLKKGREGGGRAGKRDAGMFLYGQKKLKY